MEETNKNSNFNENLNSKITPSEAAQNLEFAIVTPEQNLENVESLNQNELNSQNNDQNSININEDPVIDNISATFPQATENLNSSSNFENSTPVDDKNTYMKQKALAMLKLKQKRSEDENSKEDEKEIKKKAVEELINKTNEFNSNSNNIINTPIESNQEENHQTSNGKKLIQEENEHVEINKIQSDQSIEQQYVVIEKTNEGSTVGNQIINQPVQPVEEVKENSENKDNQSKPQDQDQVRDQGKISQAQAPVSEVPQAKTGKKISFSEAKKEIDEFTSQKEKIEAEIKDKYGINIPDYYYEDILPDELKMKLIEDFFNSEEIIDLAKKAASQ